MRNYFSALFILAAFFSVSSSTPAPGDPAVKILYSSEGLLGQIIVADYPLYEGEKKVEGSQRILFVNRSTQTIVTRRNNRVQFFEYVNLISARTRDLQGEKNALVLGLGGGSVANALVENGFQVDAVELDRRMSMVAKKYFALSEKVNVRVEDARHFILDGMLKGEKQKKYQVIVLDAFIGEVNPHHLFTQEFFTQVRSVLAEGGTLFVNGNGYWAGNVGKGMRSVCKTLTHSGFDVEVLPTADDEDYRNLLFTATRCREAAGAVSGSKIGNLELDDAIVLQDEYPRLEVLNAEANKRWREGCMKYFLRGYYSRQDMLLFN